MRFCARCSRGGDAGCWCCGCCARWHWSVLAIRRRPWARWRPRCGAAFADGYLRLILDEGGAIAPLLGRLHEGQSGRTATDSAFTAYLKRLRQALAPPAPALRADTSSAAASVLTRKELVALRMLAEGLSNVAIAERMFVSESAVRFHLRNINLKLGARSRSQAVAVARRLGMFD